MVIYPLRVNGHDDIANPPRPWIAPQVGCWVASATKGVCLKCRSFHSSSRQEQQHETQFDSHHGAGHVPLCPELDIASQGVSVEQARANLREALELFFESASAEEILRRWSR